MADSLDLSDGAKVPLDASARIESLRAQRDQALNGMRSALDDVEQLQGALGTFRRALTGERAEWARERDALVAALTDAGVPLPGIVEPAPVRDVSDTAH